MPIPPAQDPPLEHFGESVALADLPNDEPVFGPLWDVPRSPLQDVRSQASPLLFGGGVYGQGMYNEQRVLIGNTAVRALRLAFRYGINALDTSPYYYPSELVLGRALRILAPEHPRDSYFLITKCGRYGPQRSMFDYSPERVRASIQKSLERLGTTYLDGALLHDVEFVSDQPYNEPGFMAAAVVGRSAVHTPEEAQRILGVLPHDAGRLRGDGDRRVLAAAQALFELKDCGAVRNVGISGYPLGELLRISRFVAVHTGRPLDIILSYSNGTIHSDLLPAWRPLFEAQPERFTGTWNAPLLLNASPFSMGLFSDRGPPSWHPANTALKGAVHKAHADLRAAASAEQQPVMPDSVLARAALFHALYASTQRTDGVPPQRTLLGMSTVDEVHAALATYRLFVDDSSDSQRERAQIWRHARHVRDVLQDAGVVNETWASPPPDA